MQKMQKLQRNQRMQRMQTGHGIKKMPRNPRSQTVP